MRKNFVKVMFFGALALSTVTYVGCKDYDDDIDNLQTQIDAVKVSLETLQAKINSGSVITEVTRGENGVTVKLSDGSSFVLTNGKDGQNGTDGKDGQNGTDGKDAVVWTIGEDGFWYKDGEKTSYKAVGVDGTNGTDGVDGEDGEDGTNGTNGKYYVPNEDTGNFDIYQDGKLLEDSGISWRTETEAGISAIFSGNVLTLNGVEGAPEGVTIKLESGIALSSIAFIPDVVSTDVPYATTSEPFYHIKNYLDGKKVDANGRFLLQSDWDKSNVVELKYRLNPEDASVDGKTLFAFIDRKVKTRAAGDNNTLLNLKETKVETGVVSVGATINPRKLASNSEYNIAALQAWYGQKPLTSDYVHATSTAINVVLADTTKTSAGDATAKVFYSRNYVSATDANIKKDVPLTKAAHVQFKYDGSVDLREKVGLYSNLQKNWIAALGFRGMEYEFTIPEKYLANDDEKTNQQWFITKEGESTIKVNPEITNGTPAIGRMPVVIVDAYLTDNTGARRLVASSYIKLEITANDPEVEERPVYETIEIASAKEAEYHMLEGEFKAFTNNYGADNVSMDYQAINNKIYGTAKLTSATFWQHYGGADNQYNISVSVEGQSQPIISKTVSRDTDTGIEEEGILMRINLNDDATKTSAIKLGVNNKVKTQNTYKNVDGKGAKYTVTITIPANEDDLAYGDIVLTQVFYVKETCQPYNFNENYYFESYGNHKNCIVVKGKLEGTPQHWVMSSKVSEHFAMIDGKNIFAYYNTEVKNVKENGLSFKWTNATGVTPATEFSTDQDVALSAAISTEELVKEMQYTVTLINEEKCNVKYNVIFVNPFKKTTAALTTIKGNEIGQTTVETMPKVKVVDNSNRDIYSYRSADNGLVLSALATGTYKLTNDIVSVSYAVEETKEWNDFKAQLTAGSTLEVDPTTGVVTWNNEGTTLAKDLLFTVKATVTFEDLSVVICDIPVKLAAEQ